MYSKAKYFITLDASTSQYMSTRFKTLFGIVSSLILVVNSCIGQFYVNGADVIVTANGTMSVITDSVIVDNAVILKMMVYSMFNG